jgi:hypothetical protein
MPDHDKRVALVTGGNQVSVAWFIGSTFQGPEVQG